MKTIASASGGLNMALSLNNFSVRQWNERP
jgi:hypothetical protein